MGYFGFLVFGFSETSFLCLGMAVIDLRDIPTSIFQDFGVKVCAIVPGSVV